MCMCKNPTIAQCLSCPLPECDPPDEHTEREMRKRDYYHQWYAAHRGEVIKRVSEQQKRRHSAPTEQRQGA